MRHDERYPKVLISASSSAEYGFEPSDVPAGYVVWFNVWTGSPDAALVAWRGDGSERPEDTLRQSAVIRYMGLGRQMIELFLREGEQCGFHLVPPEQQALDPGDIAGTCQGRLQNGALSVSTQGCFELIQG